MIDHQTHLQIDTSELFPSNIISHRSLLQDDANIIFSEAPSSSSPSLNNIRSAVHGDHGDMIQISVERIYKGVKVKDSRATATVKRGNLVNVGLELWGDIEEGFDVKPR